MSLTLDDTPEIRTSTLCSNNFVIDNWSDNKPINNFHATPFLDVKKSEGRFCKGVV